jgi:hypothetical protein
MPTKSSAPVTRPTLPPKNPTTTTTTTFLKETISASNAYTSAQISATPSSNDSTSDIPLLGDPSLEGAYKFIGIILIYSVVFLVCFIIFAILTCRAIKTKTNASSDTSIKLNTIRPSRKNQRNKIRKSLESDQISLNSTMPFAGARFDKPGATNQYERPTPEHEIRCYSEDELQTVQGFNRDHDGIHKMFMETKQSRVLSPSRRSSPEITPPSIHKADHLPAAPNRLYTETENKHQIQADQLLDDGKLLNDGEHTYGIKKLAKLHTRYDRDGDWNQRFQG